MGREGGGRKREGKGLGEKGGEEKGRRGIGREGGRKDSVPVQNKQKTNKIKATTHKHMGWVLDQGRKLVARSDELTESYNEHLLISLLLHHLLPKKKPINKILGSKLNKHRKSLGREFKKTGLGQTQSRASVQPSRAGTLSCHVYIPTNELDFRCFFCPEE